MPRPATMEPAADTPFAALRDFVATVRGDIGGCICPVCEAVNVVKRYRLVRAHFGIMRRLAAHGIGVAQHCRTFVPDGQAYNKMLNVLKHYGLICQLTRNPANPFNRSGEWALTDRGADFISNRIRIPVYFWGIHDRAIWWASRLGSARELERRANRGSPKTLLEEIVRSSLNADRLRGQFRTEPVEGAEHG